MMDQQKDGFAIECDECGSADETDAWSFDKAWRKFNLDGWTARKIENKWTHKCPQCSGRKNWKKETPP